MPEITELPDFAQLKIQLNKTGLQQTNIKLHKLISDILDASLQSQTVLLNKINNQ